MLHGKTIKLPAFENAHSILVNKMPTKYGYGSTIHIAGAGVSIWNRHFGNQPVNVFIKSHRTTDGQEHTIYNIISVMTAGRWEIEVDELELIVNAKSIPKNFIGATEGSSGHGI